MKYDVYVNNLFQGSYIANGVNMAVAMYCADYQTTRNEIAKLFDTVPKAYPSQY